MIQSICITTVLRIKKLKKVHFLGIHSDSDTIAMNLVCANSATYIAAVMDVAKR